MAALKSYLKFLPLLASLCLTGCDDVVFTKGEVVAKRKYESVKKGDSRNAVVKSLGDPAFELVLDKSLRAYTFRDQAGKSIVLDRSKKPWRGVPVEVQFLPANVTGSRILVYSAGTVFGFIGMTDDNTVSSVRVIIS
jgi:outer membrane protein assembly factor BamE (lipoprotein component of BamABCDE complex)